MRKRSHSVAPDLVSGAIIAVGLLVLTLAIFEAIGNKAQAELFEPVSIIKSHYPPVPDCDDLYNVGKSKEYSACMGYPYR